MYTVKVLENRTDSHDVYTLILEKPEDFSFRAGQFVHLQTTYADKPIRRSYSIASAPHEETIHITIKIQEHGKVSPLLAKLEAGDSLQMYGPFGEFTRTEDSESVFIAAGTGVTPFISYLREQFKNNDHTPVTLLCSNKTQEDILYHDELSELRKTEWFSYYSTVTREEWDGPMGRIDMNVLAKHISEDTTVYVCGSNGFLRSMIALLTNLGVGPERIRSENYGNITA